VATILEFNQKNTGDRNSEIKCNLAKEQDFKDRIAALVTTMLENSDPVTRVEKFEAVMALIEKYLLSEPIAFTIEIPEGELIPTPGQVEAFRTAVEKVLDTFRVKCNGFLLHMVLQQIEIINLKAAMRGQNKT
jgi:hypothetical protein